MFKKAHLLVLFLTSLLLLLVDSSNNPVPNEKTVVVIGKARFTILTSRLIRMEWGQKVDRPTLTFINRYQPNVPDFKVTNEGEWSIIETNDLKLYFLDDGYSFHSGNLYIEVNSMAIKWRPEPYTEDKIGGNLLGTVRTLDGDDGSADLLNCRESDVTSSHCTLGLISRDGYVVVDDTGLPQFDDDPDWPWVVSPPKHNDTSNKTDMIGICPEIDQTVRSCGFPSISESDCVGRGCCWGNSSFVKINCFYGPKSPQDLYFFGHGHDYKGALREFTMFAGKIPLPPRYTFGIFYSRYWAYSDVGDMEVVREYKHRKIPLDNLVTDMDWHKTFYKEDQQGAKDAAGQRKGWTGFTWDDNLFPNPKAFLAWCKAHKLRNTLNLHPAAGIQKWEETYLSMLSAMEMDSDSEYVPWKPVDRLFANNFFKIVLKPLQDMGIDYWWLDWQQGEEGDVTGIDIPNVNPTFWINYLFFTNPNQWGPITNRTKRPLLLHRWGGLGNHRYQIGFSGDVIPGWASLHYQIMFTLRASNVLFGYWSHDLGGHTQPSPNELYTRWVQWGAFSPIFRTHCTKDAKNDRRIWTYPLDYYRIMRDAIILRGSLVPYIYTHSRDAYDTGLSLLRAMYFEYPESDESYIYDRQYFFGPNILVAPITEAVDENTKVVTKDVWIPPGSYVSWTNGRLVTGPKRITWSYTLDEIPLFVKSGSIIPMLTDGYNEDPLGSAFRTVDNLKLMIFVGDAKTGSGYLYEDDGETEGYMSTNYTNVTFSYAHDTSKKTIDINIGGSESNFVGFPSSRGYQIAIPDFWPADEVTVNGTALSQCPYMELFQEYTRDCWTYDGSKLSLIINILSKKPTLTSLQIQAKYGSYGDQFDPYNINVKTLSGTTTCVGFRGMIRRLVYVKNLLDDQWGIHTVYQEDYDSLISASEAGMQITFAPKNISKIINNFKTNFDFSSKSIYNLNVSPALLSQLEVDVDPLD